MSHLFSQKGDFAMSEFRNVVWMWILINWVSNPSSIREAFIPQNVDKISEILQIAFDLSPFVVAKYIAKFLDKVDIYNFIHI